MVNTAVLLKNLVSLLIVQFGCLKSCVDSTMPVPRIPKLPIIGNCNKPCIINTIQAKITLNKPLGDTVEMQCDVDGILKQSQLVIWEKDGETIFMNKVAFHRNSRLMLRQTELTESRVSSTLVFRNLQMSDQGSYICKISDSDEELTFSLSVYEPKPEIFYSKLRKVKIKAPGYILEKEPFNISCTIDTSISQSKLVTVDWYRNGIYLSTSNTLGRILIKQIISLSISNIYTENTALRTDDIIRSSAILLFQYPSAIINGLYECRAYKPISQQQYFHIDSAAVKIKVHLHNQNFGSTSSEAESTVNLDVPPLQSNGLTKQKNHLLQNDGLGKKEVLLLVNPSKSVIRNVESFTIITVIICTFLLDYVY